MINQSDPNNSKLDNHNKHSPSPAQPEHTTRPAPPPPPLLLDIYAAAQRLSVSAVTIRKLVRQRRLARVPNIRKLLIPELSLQHFASTAE